MNDRTKKAIKDDSVWALKDINFSVQKGEVGASLEEMVQARAIPNF